MVIKKILTGIALMIATMLMPVLNLSAQYLHPLFTAEDITCVMDRDQMPWQPGRMQPVLVNKASVQKRSSVLTISYPGLVRAKIAVSQTGSQPVLNVSAKSFNLNGKEGSSSAVMIISNAPWRLECSEPWISSNITAGDGSRLVVITALENYDTEIRTAKISVTVTGLPPELIEVRQKPGHEE